MRRIVLAVALCVTPPLLAAPEPVRPVYIVERIGTLLADDAPVGFARAGLLCAPNRSLKWKDVTAGGAIQQREIVQEALDDAGLQTSTLVLKTGQRRGTERRVVGEISDAHFGLCDRHWGLGRTHALSGEATLSVKWRIETPDGSAAPFRYTSQTKQAIAPADAAALGTIYQRLLTSAATDLAQQLAPPAADTIGGSPASSPHP